MARNASRKLKSRRTQKRVAAAQERLRRMEEVIAPYSRPQSPQTRPPRSEWVPGDFANVRRNEGDHHDHRLMVVE